MARYRDSFTFTFVVRGLNYFPADWVFGRDEKIIHREAPIISRGASVGILRSWYNLITGKYVQVIPYINLSQKFTKFCFTSDCNRILIRKCLGKKGTVIELNALHSIRARTRQGN
jgi:hypothetical protein